MTTEPSKFASLSKTTSSKKKTAPPISSRKRKKKSKISQDTAWRLVFLLLIGFFVMTFFALFDVTISPRTWGEKIPLANSSDPLSEDSKEIEKLSAEVLPEDGVTLPAEWNDLGKQMVDAGVIDAGAFEKLYEQRGGLTEDQKQLLRGEGNGALHIDEKSAPVLLNLLWALGLSNKNAILDEGPMQDPEYGGADGFASTGGWTLAKGDSMDHYSTYEFVTLTPDQQQLVESVSKGIYRPCCGNSTHFPDCNHGMAMLGLLELMASQGASEEEMYEAALSVNSYWFPDTYLTIAKYFEAEGTVWKNVSPKQVLGEAFSSGSGFAEVQQIVEPVQQSGGGGCGV